MIGVNVFLYVPPISSDEEPTHEKHSKAEEHPKGIDEVSESEEESEEEKQNEDEAKEEEEEEEGKKTPVQMEKKKKKDSSGESDSSDDSDIEGETASALFMVVNACVCVCVSVLDLLFESFTYVEYRQLFVDTARLEVFGAIFRIADVKCVNGFIFVVCCMFAFILMKGVFHFAPRRRSAHLLNGLVDVAPQAAPGQAVVRGRHPSTLPPPPAHCALLPASWSKGKDKFRLQPLTHRQPKG
ncbi:hypothetical protein CHARACLAT_014175 [Characodon lateralis]|uniref:Transcription initiation factor IIF subunit alpha n=1 Tax=Characodon lateralis TaxID=208331 RepID=A0ABU7E154_9TELE|nr:hypothetical protein [Characodon lateralis]